MAYWILSLGLIVFGFIAAFSIGMPFLMVGGALLVLGQVRHRPAFFWPPLAAVIAYNIGYWTIVPLYCNSSQTVDGNGLAGAATTVCSSILGGQITVSELAGPSIGPANNAGFLLAGLTFVVVLAVILVHRRRQSSGTGTPSTLNPPST